jgi:hypothetical protein
LCSLLSVEDAVLGFGQPGNFARRDARGRGASPTRLRDCGAWPLARGHRGARALVALQLAAERSRFRAQPLQRGKREDNGQTSELQDGKGDEALRH